MFSRYYYFLSERTDFFMSFFSSLIAFVTAMFMAFFNLFGLCGEPKTDISQCKNVIFLIGDGMGFNSIEKTKFDCNVTLDGFDAFTVRGESRTCSSSSPITDSAAGGTALATANKTTNGCIGVYPYDILNVSSHPMNLTELAISQGKLAGVITTDKTSGATPASFSAHTRDRGDEEKITSQQLSGELTLCWGTATKSFTTESAQANGFVTITDKASMDALEEGGRSFGQFTEDVWHNYENKGMPTLTQMTEKAIDLLDDDEDGFFLMVEAAHIDKNNHSNNGEGMTDALQSFDKTLSYVLDYAEKDGNTLVVVTADHETGGITFRNGEYKYTSTGHTGVNVPLLVYGCDDFMDNGEVMENTEVSRRVACAMGEKNFPIKVKN